MTPLACLAFIRSAADARASGDQGLRVFGTAATVAVVSSCTTELNADGSSVNVHCRIVDTTVLALKDTLLDSMNGVAKDSLRSRAEGSEASAFGMHQADAGSDAYDRDFALSLLSQEQDSLYEIDEALKRIENGTYGICEMSGKTIPHARLEALPFTRYTVECQAELEKRNRFQRVRQPVISLFGLSEEEGGEEDEESSSDSKD